MNVYFPPLKFQPTYLQVSENMQHRWALLILMPNKSYQLWFYDADYSRYRQMTFRKKDRALAYLRKNQWFEYNPVIDHVIGDPPVVIIN